MGIKLIKEKEKGLLCLDMQMKVYQTDEIEKGLLCLGVQVKVY